MRESVKVLNECIQLQDRKSRDYQSEHSRIRQADHYPRGTATILDMVHQKMTRMYSVMEAAEHGSDPNFESLEDSAKDAINYLSFAVSYMRGEMDGQKEYRDFLNRPIKSDSSLEGMTPEPKPSDYYNLTEDDWFALRDPQHIFTTNHTLDFAYDEPRSDLFYKRNSVSIDPELK